MEIFFLFGIVIASRHYFATWDFSQSPERNGKCFPALDKKTRFCSFSFPQYLPWTPGEAWANHVEAVNCAMKAISCFPHSSLTQRKVIFLPFVNLDMIFSFFGSSWSTTKVEVLLSVLKPAGKTLFCLYRKQSDCDIDLFVSLNAMQAWWGDPAGETYNRKILETVKNSLTARHHLNLYFSIPFLNSHILSKYVLFTL